MTSLYHGIRHRRVMMLLVAALLALLVCVAVALLGHVSGDDESRMLGALLSLFFAATVIALEFFARRYVVRVLQTDEGVFIETRSLFGTHSAGRIVSIGDEVRETTDVQTRHHRVVVEPSGKSFVLDVTTDREIAGKIRKALGRSARRAHGKTNSPDAD